MHAGHQKLFNLAKKYKKKFNLKNGVITFEPMPKMYFNKNLKNFRISNLYQKRKILEKAGVDAIFGPGTNITDAARRVLGLIEQRPHMK